MMEEKKYKITAPKRDGAVEIIGLDEVIFQAIDSERLIGKYERFTEDVLLSCVMPEIPRYVISYDEDDGTQMGGAHEALHDLLARYRKMTAWFRANKIDVEAVVGDDNGNVKN